MPLNKIYFQLFFELLRAGMEGKTANPQLFLSENNINWNVLYQFSIEQTVVAVVWDGMLTLPKELHPDKELFYHWLSKVLSIEKLNKRMNKVCLELIKNIEDAGIAVTLLKGQGIGILYPEPLHRQCGDIDLYSGKKGYTALLHMTSLLGAPQRRSRKHVEYLYEGIPLEIHRYIAFFFSPLHAKRLEKIVKSWYPEEQVSKIIEGKKVKVPPSWFEALFGVIHFASHLHLEGVGLRHLCDWIVIIRQKDLDRERYETGLHKLGLSKMALVMEELSEKIWTGNETIEKLSPIAQKVLHAICEGGNFGHYKTNARNHLYASEGGGYWKTLFRLSIHDLKRGNQFFSLFPSEAFLAPFFRIGGYIRRKGV